MRSAVMAVEPNESFYVVSFGDTGGVTDIGPISESGAWLNGGYFIFRQEIFDYMRPGDELVVEPFKRLIAEGRLMAYSYTGFWEAMDTFKDKQRLDDLFASGDAPWELWKHAPH